MQIVVLDGYTLNPGDLSWDELRLLGDVKIYDRTPADKTIERAGTAEILLTNKTLLMAPEIEALHRLKYIGVLATGYNVVDTEAAKQKGIVVTNVPAYSTMSVAQHVFALIMEFFNGVGVALRWCTEWKMEPQYRFLLLGRTSDRACRINDWYRGFWKDRQGCCHDC